VEDVTTEDATLVAEGDAAGAGESCAGWSVGSALVHPTSPRSSTDNAPNRRARLLGAIVGPRIEGSFTLPGRPTVRGGRHAGVARETRNARERDADEVDTSP
jgi:hypothetical protein